MKLVTEEDFRAYAKSNPFMEYNHISIVSVSPDRCVVKVDGKSAPKKVARLQKIAREAAMQSGRGVIPQVLAPPPSSRRWRNIGLVRERMIFGCCSRCQRAR